MHRTVVLLGTTSARAVSYCLVLLHDAARTYHCCAVLLCLSVRSYYCCVYAVLHLHYLVGRLVCCVCSFIFFHSHGSRFVHSLFCFLFFFTYDFYLPVLGLLVVLLSCHSPVNFVSPLAPKKNIEAQAGRFSAEGKVDGGGGCTAVHKAT